LLDLGHVLLQLGLELLCPDDVTSREGDVSDLGQHGVLGVLVLILELLLQHLNVLLDSFQELGLVLLDGSLDTWPLEELVELAEDTKHVLS
jgi:hypothetical protein